MEIDSGDSAASYNLGKAYGEMNNLPQAVISLNKALELRPEEISFLRMLAKTYERQGQMHLAIETYHRAAGIQPENHEIYNNIGVLNGMIGNIDGAIAALEQAIRIRPNFGGALGNLAIAYWQKGDMAKASHFGKEAIKYGGRIPPELQKELNA